MKRFVYFVILIMILSLCPVMAHAETDVIQEVKDFIAEHGSDPDNNGKLRYCADMKGGGTFNISSGDGYVECWIENSEQDEDGFYRYKFSIAIKPPYDGDIAWGCLITDDNGHNSASGNMKHSDNVDSELVCDEYEGDDYLYKSFMENAHNFRDALILAIANDLNYYFDKNLDYFGINPQFFCVEGHDFGEWIYQKNATKQANGTEKRQCSTCFATEEREVEGTMIQVPQQSTETVPAPTPEKQPEVQPEPETQPETEIKTEPETDIEVPDYQFEIEETPEDGQQDTQKPKKTLPSYALPLGITLVTIVAVTVVLLVVKAKRTEKQDDDEDLFRM